MREEKRYNVYVIAIAATCLFLVSTARPECVVVEDTSKPQEASSHVRVAVILGNKPLKGVKVDFYQPPSQLRYSVSTDENGFAAPPELASGDYNVVATLNDDVSTTLWLRVVGKEGVTALSMDLTAPIQQSQLMLDAAKRKAEELPIREHVRRFQGTVIDFSGAIVPGARIEVMRKGPREKNVILQIKTDAKGTFSAPLQEGSYIAFFFTQGFRTEIVPFEVKKDGSGEMRIALTIGRC
jgi:Carboxypeptidase regulatory-like domain